MALVLRLFGSRYVLLVVLLPLWSACQKDDDVRVISPDQQSFIDNLDSIQRYASEIYLWREQLGVSDKERLMLMYPFKGDDVENYRLAISSLTKTAINLRSGVPYEYNAADPAYAKYSTIVQGFSGKIGDLLLSKKNHYVENNFGIALCIENQAVFILYVDQNSPAGKMMLKRGDKILSINDLSVDSDNYLELWSQAARISFVKLLIQSGEGTAPKEIRMMGDRYQKNPVLAHRILTTAHRTLGYIAYSEFLSETITKEYLHPVFADFRRAEVDELIIDLRYNGGGYQNTVIYLANQICGKEANGRVMFTEHYNSLMQAGNATILKNQFVRNADNSPVYINGREATLFDVDFSVEANTINFEKNEGFSSLKKVYFIVSEYTASASELLINVVKPYVDVHIIGVSLDDARPIKTFGKPVGFFDIDIAAYKLYLAMYQTKNAAKEGDYFEGMDASYSTYDNPHYDFGDPGDDAMKIIVGQASSANFASTTRKRTSTATSEAAYVFDGISRGILIKGFEDFCFR